MSQELNKESAKLKLNTRLYGWTSEEDKRSQRGRERERERKWAKRKTTVVVKSLHADTKKWTEK